MSIFTVRDHRGAPTLFQDGQPSSSERSLRTVR